MKKLIFLFALLFSKLVTAQQHTFTSFSPTFGKTGDVITLKGTNLTGISGTGSIKFGTANAASFTVINATTITAVVGAGATGNITIIKSGFTNKQLPNFTYTTFGDPTVTEIITDFNSSGSIKYWKTSTASNSSILPNNSHNLLSFKYKGEIYSTGVNDDTLTNRGISFNAGNFKALPVELIGKTKGSDNLIVAASKIDGNPTSANFSNSNIKDLTMQSVVMDGIRGLDLGTGYTNLSSSVTATYRISILVDSKITDDEPDLIITQIADPSTNTDTYTFIDANGVKVGDSIKFSMNNVSKLGKYRLDLFTVASLQDIDVGKPNDYWHSGGQDTTREIRVVALRLSDFGLNSGNFNLVKGLKIRPSGTSDVAFIGYNVNAIKALPIITRKNTTDETVCVENDSAKLAVNVTSTYGDILTYQWQKKIGSDWVDLTNTSKYVGVDTTTLTINYDSDTTVDFDLEYYRIKVVSTNAEDSSYSSQFKVSLAPTSCFLPVELLSFSYDCDNSNFIWETASENNSKSFILESSSDGSNWVFVSITEAAGNSTSNIQYIVNQRVLNNYYRLKQIDMNGVSKTYDAIKPCLDNVFLTKPNPSNAEFSLLISSNKTETTTLVIFDTFGKKVLEKEIDLIDGLNSFLIDENLTNGIYFIQVSGRTLKHRIYESR